MIVPTSCGDVNHYLCAVRHTPVNEHLFVSAMPNTCSHGLATQLAKHLFARHQNYVKPLRQVVTNNSTSA